VLDLAHQKSKSEMLMSHVKMFAFDSVRDRHELFKYKLMQLFLCRFV